MAAYRCAPTLQPLEAQSAWLAEDSMIEEERGSIEYEEHGLSGPTLVLVPGSCSTGAAWRPVMKALGDRFRFVTTSLLGYGATAERRTEADRKSVV